MRPDWTKFEQSYGLSLSKFLQNFLTIFGSVENLRGGLLCIGIWIWKIGACLGWFDQSGVDLIAMKMAIKMEMLESHVVCIGKGHVLLSLCLTHGTCDMIKVILNELQRRRSDRNEDDSITMIWFDRDKNDRIIRSMRMSLFFPCRHC